MSREERSRNNKNKEKEYAEETKKTEQLVSA
jgi:hypothetical protein